MARSRAIACVLAAVLTVLAAAGCDRPAAPPAGGATVNAADAAIAARISGLPPGQLDIVLFRAIRDAGNTCQGIAATARLAAVNGRPAWSARCDDGASYRLVLNPGGMFAVTAGRALGQP